MQVAITCETLGDLDGGAARAIIDAAFREAVRDLEDRGDDGKPRKVVVTVTFETLDNGHVETRVEAQAKIPQRRTASTIASIRRDQGAARLLFQTDAPDDPAQRTIDELE